MLLVQTLVHSPKIHSKTGMGGGKKKKTKNTNLN